MRVTAESMPLVFDLNSPTDTLQVPLYILPAKNLLEQDEMPSTTEHAILWLMHNMAGMFCGERRQYPAMDDREAQRAQQNAPARTHSAALTFLEASFGLTDDQTPMKNSQMPQINIQPALGIQK